jgi:phage tail sheath protein FI
MATTYLAPGVYVEEIDTGPKPLSPAETAMPAFIGYTVSRPPGPDGLKPTLVTSWQQYLDKFGGFDSTCLLPIAVKGYFDEGGKKAYIVSIDHRAISDEPARFELTAAGPAAKPAAVIKAVTSGDSGDDGDDASGTDAAKGATDPPVVNISRGAMTEEGESTYNVNVVVGGQGQFEGGAPVEGVTLADLVATLNNSGVVTVELAEGFSELPEFKVPMGDVALQPVLGDPRPVKPPEVEGSEKDATGIRGLLLAEDVTILICPDLKNMATDESGEFKPTVWKGVQQAMIAHCELMGNRMAILDVPEDKVEPQDVLAWREGEAMYDSAYAALYYPWIRVTDPNPRGNGLVTVPPSGHVAGVWARNDGSRGVWKAPANETLNTVQDITRKITQVEQEFLNPKGINAIRSFGSRGIRIWGARTLSSDPSWQYINVRRLFNMIEQTILDQMQWVVFEPNDMALWERVSRTISGFLNGLWRDGALFGATADEAYSVRCDAELNPLENRRRGMLVTEIAIAPVFPAEFVIFRLSQKTQPSGE